MTTPIATLIEPAAELRWQGWIARGAAHDRRTATRMRTLMFVIAGVFVLWFSVA